MIVSIIIDIIFILISKESVLLVSQKWLGLEHIPRGFVPAIYTVLRKLPETRSVVKSQIVCLCGSVSLN